MLLALFLERFCMQFETDGQQTTSLKRISLPLYHLPFAIAIVVSYSGHNYYPGTLFFGYSLVFVYRVLQRATRFTMPSSSSSRSFSFVVIFVCFCLLLTFKDKIYGYRFTVAVCSCSFYLVRSSNVHLLYIYIHIYDLT